MFAFLADDTNGPQWRASVLDVRLNSGVGMGAVYEQGVKGRFGRRVAADCKITVNEPDQRIEFRAIAGPVRPEGSCELQPVDGGARLTFSLRCSPSGFAKLMTPMVAETLRFEVSRLDRVRAVLES